MKRVLHHFGRLLVLAIFLYAAWLLYERLKHYTPEQIFDAVRGIPRWHIVAASLLTVFNYLILVGYDWFAVRWVRAGNVSLGKIALASFTGYAFSYNFGATLFGTSIRYRLYSAWGVPLLKIVDLLLILGLTFWFGVFALAGVVFIASPLPIPEKLRHIPLALHSTFWLGLLMLVIAGALVAFIALRQKRVKPFGWQTFWTGVLTLVGLVLAVARFPLPAGAQSSRQHVLAGRRAAIDRDGIRRAERLAPQTRSCFWLAYSPAAAEADGVPDCHCLR